MNWANILREVRREYNKQSYRHRGTVDWIEPCHWAYLRELTERMKEGLSSTDESVFEMVQKECGESEIVGWLGLPEHTVRYSLRKLREKAKRLQDRP